MPVMGISVREIDDDDYGVAVETKKVFSGIVVGSCSCAGATLPGQGYGYLRSEREAELLHPSG
jgi:hypothetical protein